MVTVINSNKELTKRESYKLTLDPSIKKMRDFIGVQIEVTAYCLYKDVNKDGKDVEVLSIMDKDGGVYATNSDTFKRDFMNIADLMDGECYTIEIISGQSKAGREFITCTLV